MATATLSLALPLTVNTALLQCWFAVGELMPFVGLAVSAKLAVNVRLDAITNFSVAPFVVELPVQPVKPKPAEAVTVIE